MEPEASLLYLKQTATGPYSVPDKLNFHPHIPRLYDPFR
jgi:hypothetical protein